MSELKQIISTFGFTERKKFEFFLDKKNKRQDVRNIKLFNAILKGTESKIKDEVGENAFNVLSKRLKDNALDFIAFQALENESDSETRILKDFLSAKRLLKENKYKIGFKILSKIEERCYKIEAYAILLEIYRLHISYGFLESSEKLNQLFHNYEKVSFAAFEKEKLNLVYAKIRQAFETLNPRSTDFKLGTFVREQFDQYSIDSANGYSFKTLYQISEVVNESGAHYKNLHSVNLFFADKLAELKGSEKDTDEELLYHIKLLYTTANVFYRKQDFMISLFYLDELERQLQRSDKKYFDQYSPKIEILRAFNLNFSGHNKMALEKVNHCLTTNNGSKSNIEFDLILAAAMLEFHQSKFSEAYERISDWNRTDSFYEKQLGAEWVVNKNLLELILKIELNDTVDLEAKIISLRRKYGAQYKSNNEQQFISFLGVLKIYGQNKLVANTKPFKSKVEKSMNWKSLQNDNLFLQSFYLWLKAKIEGTELYTTILDAMKK